MKNTAKLFHIILLLCISIALPSPCLAWRGKVVSVTDGDTLKVMHGKQMEKIKLYGIAAPVKKQNFGLVAKEYMASLVAGRNVDVDPKDTDRSKRTIALVFVNGYCVNELMIKNGYAWVYRPNCVEIFCSGWINNEELARSGGVGMWNDPYIVPPWEFKHR